MSQNYAERQPAKRLFAAELNEADYHFKETDEDRAPNYLLLPSGDKANRVMMGGTLMSVEDVSNEGNDPFWKAVIQDRTGEFRAFAGKYSPEAASVVLQGVKQDESMPPAYVIVIGKTREYRPEDDESEILINIQPETIAIVSEEQRNNFIKETAEHTINRLENETGEYVLQADERHGDRVSLLKNDVRESLGMLE
jgi:RPA family protein